MDTKTTQKKPFMPAPRPASRVNSDEARKLIEGTADLGFARSGGAGQAPAETPPETASVRPLIMPQPREAVVLTDPVAPPSAGPVEHREAPERTETQVLRLDAPLSVWRSLKLASMERRVSLRFLVMEALLKAGYDVPLEEIAKDGRRDRKWNG